jgi:hypothetical protein
MTALHLAAVAGHTETLVVLFGRITEVDVLSQVAIKAVCYFSV